GSLIRSKSVLFEPIQKIRIDAPTEWVGGITREVTTRRGIIEDMPVEGGVSSVIGKMPVAESFGFSNDIRAATQGRAVWNTENAGFVEVPQDIFHKVCAEIRQRKGLKEELPGEAQYTD
ncbi:MAG TPA: elongation factor EF-2, partial [Candidatus Thalassarchaeaceae archaeon]|nr:elongation factor EF-2 [Candidatus Thalassarchaeaceae archaeon]